MKTSNVVIKIMITKIMTWMTDRMTDWKGKKLWLEQEIGQAYMQKKKKKDKKKKFYWKLEALYYMLPNWNFIKRSLIPSN